jgi:hypothetical protein
MKLKLILTTAIVGAALALPGVSGAQADSPKLVLEENCSMKDAQGVQIYGVTVGVTGFPPNTDFTATLSFQDLNPDGSTSGGSGSVGPATFTTDANGEFITFFGSVGVRSVFILTVDSPYVGGTQSKTVFATCEPTPTTKEQCKDGGWPQFGFANQGQCVAFVERGPGPQETSGTG